MRGCSVLAASRLVAPRHHRVVAFLAQLGLNLSAPDFNFGTFTDIGLLSARAFGRQHGAIHADLGSLLGALQVLLADDLKHHQRPVLHEPTQCNYPGVEHTSLQDVGLDPRLAWSLALSLLACQLSLDEPQKPGLLQASI